MLLLVNCRFWAPTMLEAGSQRCRFEQMCGRGNSREWTAGGERECIALLSTNPSRAVQRPSTALLHGAVHALPFLLFHSLLRA